MEKVEIIEGGVCSAKGFRAAGVAAGIKYKDRKDVALIVADEPCAAAAMFTTNSLAAAPVVIDRSIAKLGKVNFPIDTEELPSLLIKTALTN